MAKTKVAILYGGRSVEHGVSINSARNIAANIDKDKYESLLIGISKQGIWYLNTSVTKDIEQGKKLSLELNPSAPAFLDESGHPYRVDMIFPVLHGTDGEDGSIQGLLKAMELPMAGTGVLGSSLSINKLMAKQVLHRWPPMRSGCRPRKSASHWVDPISRRLRRMVDRKPWPRSVLR